MCIRDSPEVGASSYSNKLLHLAWHPSKNITAVAAMNSLYLNYAL